jgi:hypothetical protein
MTQFGKIPDVEEPKTMRELIEMTRQLEPPGHVIYLGSEAVTAMLMFLSQFIDKLDARDAMLVLSIMLGERLFWLADSQDQSDFEREHNVIITPEEHRELVHIYIDKSFAGCVEAAKSINVPRPNQGKDVM